MKEVELKLRFITPCLGHIRCNDYDRFEHNEDGYVIFMQSWWRNLLGYGAKAFGKHQRLMNDVRFHPIVEDKPNRYRRYYGPGQFKAHEAYLKDQVITVRAMLPDGIDEDDFRKIMDLAGSYCGISPYGWQSGFGQFGVVAKSTDGATDR